MTNGSPRLFRKLLVDGNGGEMEVKANRLRNGHVHVFAVHLNDGQRIGKSNTEVLTEDEAGIAAAKRVVEDLISGGWTSKSERTRVPSFSLDELPEPKSRPSA